ncbi:hypothetical protein [Sulfurospirillum arcachonense]|uniref:hypothetical protein n=1 Tax=Sulfurospirillum arcachonense TaxID=57666 RepID=UPI000468DAC5|nr:hypothetical protein [Sulfurospirillum arcachonense]
MATKKNTSSVDTKNGDKIAAFGTQATAAIKAGFTPKSYEKEDQIVNARKAANVEAKKAKAKKKAKLAKASRKKNKK